MKKVRKVILSTMAATALLAGGINAAESASATTDYNIDTNAACRYTYGGSQYWSDFNNPASPYSWVCRYNSYTISVPPSITINTAGGVDFQKYCNITYPGSRAIVKYSNAYGWRCRR